MTQPQTDLSMLPERDAEAPHGCSRRWFMRAACASALLASAGITLSACDSQEENGDGGDGGSGGGGGGDGITVTANAVTMDLTKSGASALSSAGGFKHLPSAGMIVINASGTIRAFTNKCTHQESEVRSFGGGNLHCSNTSAGHGSQFDGSGQPVSGPAQTALRQFAVTRNGDTITIARA